MNKLLSVAVALWFPGCGVANEEVRESSVQASSACDAHVESNLLDESHSAGEVTVTTVEGDLVVTVVTTDTLFVGQVDAYAGAGPIPVDDAGAADPSLFPYHLVVDPPSTSAELRIPLADLALSCGDSLTLAVQSGVGYADSWTGQLIDVVPAWAGGSSGFAYAPCCDPVAEGPACTRALGSWKNAPEDWPASELDLGTTTYEAEDLLEILSAPSRGDATVILGHQLIIAKLNVAAGGQAPHDVQEAIVAADGWLDAHGVQTIPGKIHAGSTASREALALSEVLAAFNEGRSGVPACN